MLRCFLHHTGQNMRKYHFDVEKAVLRQGHIAHDILRLLDFSAERCFANGDLA